MPAWFARKSGAQHTVAQGPVFEIFPVYFPVGREFKLETGSRMTASSASRSDLWAMRSLSSAESVCPVPVASVLLRPMFHEVRAEGADIGHAHLPHHGSDLATYHGNGVIST
jgi:hypothetical protein